MRWFSYLIMAYVLAGIVWWGMLLYSKNQELHQFQVEHHSESEQISLIELEEEHGRQSMMILGEGAVLGITLIAGLWLIHRGAVKEVAIANQQRNFLLSISHELKSPLAAIKLTMQTLLRHDSDKETRTKLLKKALTENNRLEAMVQNILMTTSLDEKKMHLVTESFDLIEIIDGITSKKSDLFDKATFELTANGIDTAPIHADKMAISIALSNIYENALKYSTNIATIKTTIERKGQNYELGIADNGVGVSADDQQNVFKRFYRSNKTNIRSKGGTGLGLYLTKEIIRAHSGNIELDTHYDSGAKFNITLPSGHV